MSTLTQAWTTASAALPLGWRIHSLVLDHVIDGQEHWTAAAVQYDAGGMPLDHRGDEHFEHGSGTTPQQALENLARRLQPLRGDPNG